MKHGFINILKGNHDLKNSDHVTPQFQTKLIAKKRDQSNIALFAKCPVCLLTASTVTSVLRSNQISQLAGKQLWINAIKPVPLYLASLEWPVHDSSGLLKKKRGCGYGILGKTHG